MHIGLNVSFELDTDQGEGIRDQLRFAAPHSDYKINFYAYRFSEDEYSDIFCDQAFTPTNKERNLTAYPSRTVKEKSS